MPTPVDILPALLLSAFLLIVLAGFMPFTGRAATRRRAAWERFHKLLRIRGVPSGEGEGLARWAHVACPENPHYVLVRRQDFDRFVRSELHRVSGQERTLVRARVRRLGELRRLLGFDRSPGYALSTHDLVPDELLTLRLDDERKLSLRVEDVDEEGIHVSLATAGRAPRGAGWATFEREGEGHYRFRTHPLRDGLLAHGEFLVHEERRREPRVPLQSPPFWVAVERLPDGAAPEDPEGVEVEVVDVSVGGLALLADREVRRGSQLWLDLSLGEDGDGPQVRGLRATVLGHGYREGGGVRPHFLHCHFVELSPLHRRVLEAFVWGRVESRQAS